MAHSKASRARNNGTHPDYIKRAFEANPRKHNGYTRIFKDLYFSDAYKTLSPTAKDVLTGLMLISNGNSPFKATFHDLQGRCSSSSFTNAIKQLDEHGILRVKQRKSYYDIHEFEFCRNWVDYHEEKTRKKVNTKSLENLWKGTGNRAKQSNNRSP